MLGLEALQVAHPLQQDRVVHALVADGGDQCSVLLLLPVLLQLRFSRLEGFFELGHSPHEVARTHFPVDGRLHQLLLQCRDGLLGCRILGRVFCSLALGFCLHFHDAFAELADVHFCLGELGVGGAELVQALLEQASGLPGTAPEFAQLALQHVHLVAGQLLSSLQLGVALEDSPHSFAAFSFHFPDQLLAAVRAPRQHLERPLPFLC